MISATVDGTVIAEADRTVYLEGNHYFAPEDVNEVHLHPSATRTVCPWKGVAHYYDVEVDGVTLRDAAWTYPRTSPLARRIRGRIAFWRGVEVGDSMGR